MKTTASYIDAVVASCLPFTVFASEAVRQREEGIRPPREDRVNERARRPGDAEGVLSPQLLRGDERRLLGSGEFEA